MKGWYLPRLMRKQSMTRKFVVNLDMIRVFSLMNYYNDIIVNKKLKAWRLFKECWIHIRFVCLTLLLSKLGEISRKRKSLLSSLFEGGVDSVQAKLHQCLVQSDCLPDASCPDGVSLKNWRSLVAPTRIRMHVVKYSQAQLQVFMMVLKTQKLLRFAHASENVF